MSRCVMAFSTARRCSPNLSPRRRLVSPMYWILHLVHCITDVHEVRRRAGDVMPYTFLLVSSEESVRRGSFFNKRARFTPQAAQAHNARSYKKSKKETI